MKAAWCDMKIIDGVLLVNVSSVSQKLFLGSRPFIACSRLLSLQEKPPCKDCKVGNIDIVKIIAPGKDLCKYCKVIKEPVRKKNTGFFGSFSQMSDPHPPPFGNFDHFLPIFFGQVGNFWVILRCFRVF